MNSALKFSKAEATGNDFICLNSNDVSLKTLVPEKIKELCDRHLGIGADGVLYLSGKVADQIQMRYFNADGSRGEMCGNGLRAATLFACSLGFIQSGQAAVIKADDGRHHVFMKNSSEIEVELFYGEQKYPPALQSINIPPRCKVLGFVNTGVPHLVLEAAADLTQDEIIKWGRMLRFDQFFQPQGTNVDFVRYVSENELFVRTYERGVENETLSCGSGVSASALLLLQRDPVATTEIKVKTLGGELLVAVKDDRIFLKGPARIVFTGKVNL